MICVTHRKGWADRRALHPKDWKLQKLMLMYVHIKAQKKWDGTGIIEGVGLKPWLGTQKMQVKQACPYLKLMMYLNDILLVKCDKLSYKNLCRTIKIKSISYKLLKKIHTWSIFSAKIWEVDKKTLLKFKDKKYKLHIIPKWTRHQFSMK